MRIVFTGGGSGGHFYPIIAVKKALDKEIGQGQHSFYFLAPDPYNLEALKEAGIEYRRVPAGKWRRYFSFKNFTDLIVTFWGVFVALVRLFFIYPDVVFGKGGYGSFTTLLAARILFIPVVIHESDSRPGKVNAWAGKFAERIAISYQDAAKFFPKDRVAWTGQPLRETIQKIDKDTAKNILDIKEDIPVIGIIGGSQGAAFINEGILDALPKLVENFTVIHQTGPEKLKEVSDRATVILENNQYKTRYKTLGYLDDQTLSALGGIASLVITRAGSMVFEIAHWQIPAIIIPLPKNISHDQEVNAVAYAKTGAATVITEKNFTPTILLSEIRRIVFDRKEMEIMTNAAKNFDRPDADKQIAVEIKAIAESHG